MEQSSYTYPLAEKQPSAEIPSSSATDCQGFLHSVYHSSGADDNTTIDKHLARCSSRKQPFTSSREDATSQQEIKISEQGHLNFRANNASKAEAVSRASVSRLLLPKTSRQAGGHRTPEARNASPSSCESRAVDSDADYFLQVVRAARMCKTTEQGFKLDCPRATITASASTDSSGQSIGNSRVHSECGAATVVAVRHRSVDVPDRLSAQNTYLFLQDIPHSPVTVHLLPCRISFTGTAPVRRYFRPWSLGTPLCTHVGRVRNKVISSAEIPKEAGEKKLKGGNTKKQSIRVKPILEHDMKEAVNSLASAETLPSRNPESQASPSRLDIPANREKHLSSCCESSLDNIDVVPEDTSSPQLFEALLHGRLLRGVSLPFKQWSHSLRKNQHEQFDAEMERDAASLLTEDVQGYIVMRKCMTSDHKENPSPVKTISHTVDSTRTDLEADKKSRCEQALAGSPLAHASTERKQGFLGIAEFVLLARVKQLCYWNHDTMPTPLDDVPQAFAFMQLARIVHSMSDD